MFMEFDELKHSLLSFRIDFQFFLLEIISKNFVFL